MTIEKWIVFDLYYDGSEKVFFLWHAGVRAGQTWLDVSRTIFNPPRL